MPKILRAELTPHKIKTAHKARKPRATDGLGLYLEFVHATGRAVWRMEYTRPVTGKRSRLTFGEYPISSDEKTGAACIEAARAQASAARALIAAGTDPAEVRDEQRASAERGQMLARETAAKLAAGEALPGSFRYCAEQRVAAAGARLAPSYLREFNWTMQAHVFPRFGDRMANTLTPADLRPLHKHFAELGQFATLRKVRRFIAQTMAWAIEHEHATIQPVVTIEGLYDAATSTPRPSIIDRPESALPLTSEQRVERLRALVVDIANTPSRSHNAATVQRATMLALWTLQRSATIASARKADFDLDRGIWGIPAESMKGRKAQKRGHVVFLPRQAVDMLRLQFAETEGNEWVFPGQYKAKGEGHMDRSSIGGLLVRLGYKGKHTAHGFRALGRTICAEVLGIDPIALECILAHKAAQQFDALLTGGMAGRYFRPEYATERQRAPQAWADYLDALLSQPAPVAAPVVPLAPLAAPMPTPAPAPLPIAA